MFFFTLALYLLIFVAILHKSNRWQPIILFFPKARNSKKYCESNQHRICICMCTSINRPCWYFYLVLEKNTGAIKTIALLQKHCCLKPQLASATPYYRQTRMKIRLYSFKYVIGLRHQLKTTQSNVSFWHCFKHC